MPSPIRAFLIPFVSWVLNPLFGSAEKSPVAGSFFVQRPAMRTTAMPRYVNPFANVAVPPGVVTLTLVGCLLTGGLGSGGVVTVSCVGDTTVTDVPATPPKVTDVGPATKPVPVIVTVVRPDHGPMGGLTRAIVAAPVIE
jgi:hypothetical protein